MKIIKLNAIPSTNDYLKELAQQTSIDSFTVVVADYQTKGKGQRGEVWTVEPFSNLTFSVLVDFSKDCFFYLFDLNILVANSIHTVLQMYNLSGVSIKWPNDILSYNKKIAGILIENTIKSDGTIRSIIGIGINVLQENFGNLPKASSIYKSYGIRLDKDELLERIIHVLKSKIEQNDNIEKERAYYHKYLFRKETPTLFEDNESSRFMAIIQRVDESGKLILKDNDDIEKAYDLKEIKMLY